MKVVKLNSLKIQLPEYKQLFTEISEYLEKDIYSILDDFYFIRKSDQPSFLDFFHRLSKNTPLFLKVATIKHRSLLYTQINDSYVGVEIPHDAQAVNLDYSLEDFQSLVSFMKELLNHINEKVGVSIDYSTLITENAFRFLCLASGGVPRDFLSLLISLRSMLGNDRAISKPNVIEKAIENLSNKMSSFRTDAAEESHTLEKQLYYIQNAIITEKRWNSFLISNAEVQKYSQINQVIKELVDLRFLHLVNPNVSSANSDGTRYSAYMVDIGLFPNANPRDFQQVEPGLRDLRAREDKIRSAPKLNLADFHANFKSDDKF